MMMTTMLMMAMAMPLPGRPPIMNPPKNFRRFRLMIIYRPARPVALAESPSPPPFSSTTHQPASQPYSSCDASGYDSPQPLAIANTTTNSAV